MVVWSPHAPAVQCCPRIRWVESTAGRCRSSVMASAYAGGVCGMSESGAGCASSVGVDWAEGVDMSLASQVPPPRDAATCRAHRRGRGASPGCGRRPGAWRRRWRPGCGRSWGQAQPLGDGGVVEALGDQPQNLWAVQASVWRVAGRYQRRAVGCRGQRSAQAVRARRDRSAWRTRLACRCSARAVAIMVLRLHGGLELTRRR